MCPACSAPIVVTSPTDSSRALNPATAARISATLRQIFIASPALLPCLIKWGRGYHNLEDQGATGVSTILSLLVRQELATPSMQPSVVCSITTVPSACATVV